MFDTRWCQIGGEIRASVVRYRIAASHRLRCRLYSNESASIAALQHVPQEVVFTDRKPAQGVFNLTPKISGEVAFLYVFEKGLIVGTREPAATQQPQQQSPAPGIPALTIEAILCVKVALLEQLVECLALVNGGAKQLDERAYQFLGDTRGEDSGADKTSVPIPVLPGIRRQRIADATICGPAVRQGRRTTEE